MKILLISYYAPPLNAITSLRAFTLGQQISNNHEVHLVTRHWKGTENTWSDLNKSNLNPSKIKKVNNNFSLHYLPYQETKYSSNKIFRKFTTLKSKLSANFSRNIDLDQFYELIITKFNDTQFDFIYVTSPPLSIINLGNKLQKHFKSKLICDFRDLHNNLLLKKNKEYNLKEKIELYNLKKYLKKNLKNSFLTSTASEPFTSFLTKITKADTITVLNGYETVLFKELKSERSEYFEVSVLGTLYEAQDLSIMLNSFKQLSKNKKIRFNFIGTGAIPKVASLIKKKIPNAIVTDKIERLDALKIGKRSQILFYVGWKGYKGVYSGKIFEYLGLKKNILIAPGDCDVIDNLINKNKVGISLNTEAEVIKYLELKFNEWRNNKNKVINFEGLDIDKYSRENQNLKIIKKMRKSIK